jgi:hypothetical protein
MGRVYAAVPAGHLDPDGGFDFAGTAMTPTASTDTRIPANARYSTSEAIKMSEVAEPCRGN